MKEGRKGVSGQRLQCRYTEDKKMNVCGWVVIRREERVVNEESGGIKIWVRFVSFVREGEIV